MTANRENAEKEDPIAAANPAGKLAGRNTRWLMLLFVVTVVVLTLIWFSGGFSRKRSRLPVGVGLPMISLGERHGVILASNGSLWSWGSAFLGWPVLGLGKTTERTTNLRRIGTETNWVGVSASAARTVALKSDGTLWMWGESLQVRNARPMALPVPIQAAPGNDWNQTAAGGIHVLATKKDGTLWAWGNNWAGSLGTGLTNDSAVPVQVGSGTNWVKVWADTLESVGMQSDGSLWYWGANPDPTFDQKVGAIRSPMRISPDTNWVDVGFGVNTVFAIKSDGTLWTFGRNAHVYTGGNGTQNATPMRVGTNSDWRAICSGRWWCQGLIKKDGSLWLMDASDGQSNGPQPHYKPVKFRRAVCAKDYVAYAAGGLHAAPPGIHGQVGVVLTPEGEVWTWGMVLGDPPSFRGYVQDVVARLGKALGRKVGPPDAPPIFKDKPWPLRIE